MKTKEKSKQRLEVCSNTEELLQNTCAPAFERATALIPLSEKIDVTCYDTACFDHEDPLSSSPVAEIHLHLRRHRQASQEVHPLPHSSRMIDR